MIYDIAFLKRLFRRKPKPEGIKSAHLLAIGMIETNGQVRDYTNRENELKENIKHIESLQLALLAAHVVLPRDMREDMENHLADALIDAEEDLAATSLALDEWMELMNYGRVAWAV